MTREYDTIASLWARFHTLMRSQGGADPTPSGSQLNAGARPQDESLVVPLHESPVATNPHAPGGLPGTGGYTLQVPPSARRTPST